MNMKNVVIRKPAWEITEKITFNRLSLLTTIFENLAGYKKKLEFNKEWERVCRDLYKKIKGGF